MLQTTNVVSSGRRRRKPKWEENPPPLKACRFESDLGHQFGAAPVRAGGGSSILRASVVDRRATRPNMRSELTSRIQTEVLETGWAVTQVDTACQARHRATVLHLASALGTVTATRGHCAIDELRPKTQNEARPSSMSAVFGLGAQPWHMDMAHRPSPARFIVLSCIESGEQECATELLDWRRALGEEHLTTANHEPVLVRSGRSSFYTTMLDEHRRFLRQDPTCISGLTDCGRMLQAKINETSCKPVYRMHWRPGRTLIFDNWRLLHRRADASQSKSRTLLRVTIMERLNDS